MKPSQAPSRANEPDASPAVVENTRGRGNFKEKVSGQILDAEAGVSGIEATTAVWGEKGKWLVIAGELDNSTVSIYNNYSTSSFNGLSKLATLNTAGAVLFAVMKPPIAKISNVIGRGQTYTMTMCLYILSYILMASAKSLNTYAAGYIFYVMGQSGTNIMNDIVISDISSARWRGFAIGVSFTPFLVTPWISGFITESVVNGIGWRWGIGMFAILMPFGSSFIITTLLYYQTRAKSLGIVQRQSMKIYDFCSQIDLGGVILFSGGFALVLIPLTLAATTSSRWKTPYLDGLIAVGVVLLIAFPFYECLLARYPFMPPSYFINSTISLCLFLIATDSIGFSCTHAYLYTWATVVRNFSARDATFYNATNGVASCLMGIIAGLLMMWTRRYKWLVVIGATLRLIGYGVMIRLRGASNSMFELFFVQVIQGIGSGIMQTNLLVPAQISVPHSQMPQITALVICFSFLGSSVGACIAGGIYTNTIGSALESHLGERATPALIKTLSNSILSAAPDWGSLERTAVNLAVGFSLPCSPLEANCCCFSFLTF
ncbi:major facilitator superfamily domain-containing protein [Penicillium cosmopolitanum]|uniref:Major facilitator superfamily domain-containing protein n=1 Tax=Penicillium cosmopolitanum TaxID=1131564 RepID=A0A9W9SMG2_9EURO|nr:major facilitator superfamily domain-containing protein [Penicillium cosmopolitanum]KAJ5379048.1 major facilitator superfamily domain-containing protein [Penicillium cosmopolitanum]